MNITKRGFEFLMLVLVLSFALLPAQAFAQCSTAAWSSVTGSPQALGVSTNPIGKKYEGQCGLTVNAASAPSYVTTTNPSNETLFSARFYFLPSNLDLSGGDLVIFRARSGGRTQATLKLSEVGGVLRLVASYRTGADTFGSSQSVVLQPVWQAATVHWNAGAGTGAFSLDLDGKQQINVGGFDNGSEVVNEVDLGVINSTSATGSVVFDAFEIRRTAEAPPLLAIEELFNIATRAEVQALNNIVIAGFIISGDTDKCVVVRGRGQSVNVPAGEPRLEDPILALKLGQTTIEENDNWQTHPTAQIMTDLGRAPNAASDAAFFVCLPPGAYTALLDGAPGTTQGIGIIEVIDSDQGTPYLVNIATRARVGTSNKIVIAGFIIQGAQSKQVLIRGRGPSMNLNPSLVVANPRLKLYSGNTVLQENLNWQDAPNAADIQATGRAPSNALEAAILTTLPPGAYTVWLQGENAGTGIGIIEVFDQSGGSIESN